MTTIAVDATRRAWSALPRLRAWLEAVRPWQLLVPAIALQWITTLALALTVRHNGWLYYQGGDQLWLYVSGWLLAHGQIPTSLVGHGWPALLAPFSAFGGPTLVPALPAIVLANVLLLAPIALLCIFGIADRIGGRIFAYWVVVLWLAIPFVGIKYTDALYHQRYTELTLPGSFGLTALADFPSMVAVLVCVYFVFKVLDDGDRIDALAAGVAAGAAIAVKPSNSIFLAGVVLGLALRRKLAGAAWIAAGLAPAVLTLALWKYRGYGYVPLFRSEPTTATALGQHTQLVAFNPIHSLQRYMHFNWQHLNDNLMGIREHFWSLRVVEWAVIAGLIGLARRSLTALLVVGGWFAAFVVVKGTFQFASIDDASVFRIMMPSYPAFVLMLGALVYLLPFRRRRDRPIEQRPPRSPVRERRRLLLLGSAAAVFALYPLALVAAASPVRGPEPRAYISAGLLRSVDPSLRLAAGATGSRVRLSWRERGAPGTRVFYRLWRSKAADGGASCTPVVHAADDCELTMEDIGAHRGGRFVDRPGRGTWTYRLALAANWLDDPAYGDVFSVGPPIVVRVR